MTFTFTMTYFEHPTFTGSPASDFHRVTEYPNSAMTPALTRESPRADLAVLERIAIDLQILFRNITPPVNPDISINLYIAREFVASLPLLPSGVTLSPTGQAGFDIWRFTGVGPIINSVAIGAADIVQLEVIGTINPPTAALGDGWYFELQGHGSFTTLIGADISG